jgi:hypothetical protein
MRAAVSAALLIILAGCGGGGGKVTGPLDVPAITNLHYSPASAWQFEGGGSIAVSGTVDFTDLGGDLATLRLTTSAGGDLSIAIAAPGITSGTLTGGFVIPTDVVGDYGFSIRVVDAGGRASNTLTASFPVRLDDRGVAWAARTSGITARLNAVTYTGSLVVAVGEGGVILTSADGIDWQAEFSGTTAGLRGVAWSGSRLVAVGENGTLLASDDGHAWSAATGGVANHDLEDVAWSGATFAAVGEATLTDSLHILVSADGLSWSPAPVPGSDRELRAVTWSRSEFLAVGKGGGSGGGGLDSAIVVTSPDGASWTRRAVGPAASLQDVAWTGSHYVAVGSISTVMTSADGIAWEAGPAPAISLEAVAWSGTTLVSVGTGIFASTDGAAWSQTSDQVGLYDVMWTGSRYVAVGFAGSIFTSP